MSNPQEIENKKIEAQRLTVLELLRTPENGRFIEEARVSGASVEETASKIIKSMAQSDDAAPRIAAYIKVIQDRANDLIKQSVRQGGAYLYSDEAFTSGTPDIADEVFAEIMRIKGPGSKGSTFPSNYSGTRSSQNSPTRKDGKTMSKHNFSDAEAQRISDLEAMRTPQNSHFIDAGIVSGEAAGDVALKIVNEAIEEEKSIEMMVEEAKRIIASRG
ncbi:hypothetical protein D3C74_159520 [compost metagenome]